ncbi:MAG: hypothetical protein WBO25_04500 [Acidimicrobiia bacterium]
MLRCRSNRGRRFIAVSVAAAALVASVFFVGTPVVQSAGVSYAMIGDSITWQVTDDLREMIPGIRGSGPVGDREEFGVIGRTFSKADDALASIKAKGVPDVLIVALGTNPPLSLSQIESFMARTGGITRVIFVNIRIPRDWEASTNALINSLPQRFNNVTVVDWYAYSGSHPYVLNSSGYHLSDAGKPEFAALVAAEAFRVSGACDPPTQTAPDSAGVGAVDTTRGYWYLRDPITADTTAFYYGNPGDRPFMGDWNGDGVDTPGLYRRSDGYVYLRNSNTQGIADISFYFGNPNDIPIAGDFDGDGFDTVGIYRPSNQRFYIINRLGSGDAGLGAADYDFPFGNPGDQPIVADLDGDGADTVGVYRPAIGLVSFVSGVTRAFSYGGVGDHALFGPWEGGNADTVGVFRGRSNMYFLRSSNTTGAADHSFNYGAPGFATVSGFFGDLPGGSDPPSPSLCPVS